MAPLVSICLPVFNGADFLSASIESALSQTYENIELLIADDCSADRSTEIIESYAKADSRIKFWINEKRLGLFPNYNACLSRACGDFIKPHAQDDLWHPTLVARELAALQQNENVSLVSSRRKVIDENGKVLPLEGIITAVDLYGKAQFYPGDDMIKSSLDPLRNIIGEPCTVMFRKESIGAGFATQFRHIGDIEYWLRILQHGDFAFINEDLVSFRKHARGTTAANNAQLWLASDIIHLSYAMESSLRKMGLSRHKFVRDSLYWLSCALNNLIDSGELSEKKLHKDQLLRREDMFGLKEALFHTMLVLSQSDSQNSPVGILRKELRIRELEADLRRVIDTPSWKWTRSLREMKKLVGRDDGQLAVEEFNLAQDPQEEYIQYLRKTIRKVLQSRSWKLTGRFRRWQKKHASKSMSKAPAEISATKQPHGPETITAAQSKPQLPEKASQLQPKKSQARGPNYPNNLVVGAIIKDQAPYLKEWLEFHMLVGVERFYIFDNLSTDHYKEVLQPYIQSGLVKLFHWPVEIKSQEDFNVIQCSCYRRIIDLTAESSKWLALIDVDEFMFPTEKSSLIDLLDDYDDFGGLSVNWQMFGTSNCKSIPQDKLLTETLTRCAEKDHEINLHVKTISRPEQIIRITNPHFAKFAAANKQVNEEKIPLSGSRSSYVSVNSVRINHYWTRDEHHYETRKLPSLQGYNAYLTEREFKQRLIDFNASEDLSIQRFVPTLREKVFGGQNTDVVTVR